MKVAKGIVYIEILVECPHCGSDNDVANNSQDIQMFKENKLPDPSNIHEVFECDHCGKEYLLNELEY